jgi:hypothetical protein
MVNLKNAYYVQDSPAEEPNWVWKRRFTTGGRGLASWSTVASELIKRQYSGWVCLTAEYDIPGDVGELVRKDLELARELFDSAAAVAS